MKLIEDLIGILDLATEVDDIRQGSFQNTVLICKCGLAPTPLHHGAHHERVPVRVAGQLIQKGVLELSGTAHSASLLQAAIDILGTKVVSPEAMLCSGSQEGNPLPVGSN